MSSYLAKKLPDIQERKVVKSRMSKFTMFDGLNTFEGLEYGQIDKVKNFESKSILLQLKPPITVRKGLLLLTDKNVEVLC